ncbi:MAG: protein-glutamate O-methyltransferase CheR [Alphaproteobacteria bacterium]|nr:protein-glutamate O-methyltransferase CheR [Alphaproteobacteria bacterium]MBF0391157.1 protein-glutamate O-methyltransferase CheR [Alphaproteobacteria bacterium]
MQPENLDFIAKFLKDRSGLVVTADKGYLLDSRLTPLARKRAIKDVDSLVQQLRTGRDAELERAVVEAMTTNESFFFRDGKPFDQFRDNVLPALMQARATRKSFRIWCAAASSGQEPYTIAMILKEQAAKLAGWKVEIVGTDISHDILDRAKKGVYSQFEVQRGLPIQMLVKYFKKKDELWQIDDSLRAMVDYRHHNLLQDLKSLGKFDVVFCRNVLIYFDQPTKTRVLDGIAAQMPADGWLYLGGAETVLGLTERFKPVATQRGVYSLTGAPAKV